MSTSKHGTAAFTHDSVINFLDDVELEFGQTFSTSLSLPRRVNKGYREIRLMAKVDHAHTAAPLKPLVAKKTVSERRVQRLALLYVKVSEATHCHAQLAAKNEMTNKVLQLLCVGATTITSILLTGVLRLFPNAFSPEMLLVISGVTVTVVGGISSWTKYADYESKAQRHQLASDRMRKTAIAIEDAFKLTSEDTVAVLHKAVAHLPSLNCLAYRIRKEKNMVRAAAAIAKDEAQAALKEADRVLLAPPPPLPPPIMTAGATNDIEMKPEPTVEEANLSLQLILRTAIERRYVHAWVADLFDLVGSRLQILALVGATVTYLSFFFAAGDKSGLLRAIGEIFNIGITAIGMIRSAVGFDQRVAQHNDGRRRFASIARDAGTLLAIETLEQQRCELSKLQQRISASDAPKLPSNFLLKNFKAEKGMPSYPVLCGALTLSATPDPQAKRSTVTKAEAEAGFAALDETTRSELTNLKLNEQVRKIGGKFNTAFENMCTSAF